MQIKGKITYITGAAGCLGSVIAQTFAREGAHLALLDKNTEGLQNLAQQLQTIPNHGQICPITADLSTQEGVKESIKKAQQALIGPVGILICNVGALVKGDFRRLTPQDWAQAFDLNFFTHIWTIKEVLPHFHMPRKGGGHIVVIGSDQGSQPDAYLGAYATAKAALHTLVKVLARELPPEITINAIAPGMVRSPMVLDDLSTLYQYQKPHIKERLIQAEIGRRGIPLNRLAEPEEVAQAILFLVQTQYSHGCILDLSGGNKRSV